MRVVCAAAALLAAGCFDVAQSKDLDAEIRWTQYGIPHVKAADYASLGFGYGYAVAGDELCVLVHHIVTVRGERSRWFGPQATTSIGSTNVLNIDSDLFFRVQLSDAEVDAAARSLSVQARDLVRGYAAGFNRFVGDTTSDRRARRCDGVPLTTMTSADVLRFVMYIGSLWRASEIAPFASLSTWEALTAEEKTAPAAIRSSRASTLGAEDPMGSNAWAFGSDVTGTGSAIVVANPHTAWGSSWQRMHQFHLTIPGEIDVAGASFAGLPVPAAGFTRDVAWSIKSPIGVRYHVLVALDVRGGHRPAFVVDGLERPLDSRVVKLDVRDADGTVRAQSFLIPYSSFGPLYRVGGKAGRQFGWYAVTDANAGNARGIDQLLAAARARNVAEFARAVAAHRGITARLIAGDRRGKALYVEAGPLLDIPERTIAGCALDRAAWVFDGTMNECFLRTRSNAPRLAVSAALPSVITRGAVQFASTSYRFALLDRLLSGYPLLFGDALETPGARTLMSQRHLAEVLGDGRITPDEAVDVMFSNRNYAAETTLDAILRACKRSEANSRATRACSILAGWDRRNNSASRGALLFAQAWPRLQAIPNFYVHGFDPAHPYKVLPVSETDQVADGIVKALVETMAALEALGLKGDEPWGQVLARKTDSGRVPMHGGSAEEGVLNVILAGPLQSQGYADVRYGSSYAHVVTWRDGELDAKVLLAHGQSIDPASPHYIDQLRLFAEKELQPLPFSEARIKADPGYRYLRLRQP